MIYQFVNSDKEHHRWARYRQIGDIIYLTDENIWFKNLASAEEDRWETCNITNEVNKWLAANKIKSPFKNKEDELLFRLTFE